LGALAALGVLAALRVQGTLGLVLTVGVSGLDGGLRLRPGGTPKRYRERTGRGEHAGNETR